MDLKNIALKVTNQMMYKHIKFTISLSTRDDKLLIYFPINFFKLSNHVEIKKKIYTEHQTISSSYVNIKT